MYDLVQMPEHIVVCSHTIPGLLIDRAKELTLKTNKAHIVVENDYVDEMYIEIWPIRQCWAMYQNNNA